MKPAQQLPHYATTTATDRRPQSHQEATSKTARYTTTPTTRKLHPQFYATTPTETTKATTGKPTSYYDKVIRKIKGEQRLYFGIRQAMDQGYQGKTLKSKESGNIPAVQAGKNRYND